jgi:outer membrane protein assembly factor BamD (BamD/ComL family)
VIYVGPLRDMASGAKMYTTLLERYPESNEAETAQYHLATLAYWKKDWDKALSLYRQVVETWPDGRYAEFIAEQRAPELASLMKTKSKTKRGTS